MAYYHLDKSQRYIQSLGFTGNNGILNKQIRINSNAQDNYYHPFFTETAYSESDKALSFLGSAVGDRTKITQAEETDILLFEYMQAMIYDLHPNFGGGDQAAIAGGLGMYWAFSHNYAETQESSDELFQWGDYFLQNKTGSEGDPDRQDMPELELKELLGSGYNSDYLYTEISGLVIESGPSIVASAHALALIEMTNADGDEGRKAADKITLEALKNYKHSMQLPDWGRAVIKAAAELYPNKSYAYVYQKQFTYKKFGVINPLFTVHNNFLPGDNVTFDLTLKNQSSIAIDNARLLTYTDGNRLHQPLGTLAANSSYQFVENKLTVAIPADAKCGDKYERSYQIIADSPVTEDSIFDLGDFTYTVGKESITEYQTESNAVITEDGIISKINISNSGATLDNFAFEIVIEHSDYYDLMISILPPGESEWIDIIDEYGDGDIDYTKNMVLSATETVYVPKDNKYVPRYPQLAKLKGRTMDGEWQLKVSDFDTDVFNGQLLSWKLKQSSYTCDPTLPKEEVALIPLEPATTPLVPLVPAEPVNLPPDLSRLGSSISHFAYGGHQVSFDASLAFDPENQPLTFDWKNIINEGTKDSPELISMEGTNSSKLTVTFPNSTIPFLIYTFELTVSDGENIKTKPYTIVIKPNTAPVINEFDANTLRLLDDTDEYLIEVPVTNKEPESLNIEWAITAGDNVNYRTEENRLYIKKASLAEGSNPLRFTITATDEGELSTSKAILINLEGETMPINEPAVEGDSESSAGSFGSLLSIFSLLVLINRRNSSPKRTLT